MCRSKKIASAVCMYTLDDIEDTMTSNFLVEDRNSWKEIGNGNFLHGVRAFCYLISSQSYFLLKLLNFLED